MLDVGSEKECTGLIMIVAVPKNDAPPWVRQAFVRLTLPCGPYLGYPNGPELDIISREKRPRRLVFAVPQSCAIEILRQDDPTAAKWLNDHGYPHPNEYFAFGEDEAVIVSGVTRQEPAGARGEGQGDSNQ